MELKEIKWKNILSEEGRVNQSKALEGYYYVPNNKMYICKFIDAIPASDIRNDVFYLMHINYNKRGKKVYSNVLLFKTVREAKEHAKILLHESQSLKMSSWKNIQNILSCYLEIN